MGKVTAKDVASLAGVDPSAVSRVLNESLENHSYSTETIDRIRRAAAELGYMPSMAAKMLRTGKSMLLGILVSDIANPFFAELAANIERSAWEHGYRVVICSTGENPDRQEKHIVELIARGIDGLVISPIAGSDLPDLPPAVAIDRPAEGAGGKIPAVHLDNEKAGLMLGQHLAERGYREIGVSMLAGDTDPTLDQRYKGLLKGLGEAGRVVWTVEVPTGNRMKVQAEEMTANLLKTTELPDAVVGLTNWCTLGSAEAMAKLDIEWGDKIGLAGIDDFLGADLMKPSITVIAQPVEDIAATATDILLELISEDEEQAERKPLQSKLLEPILIKRNSLPIRTQKI